MPDFELVRLFNFELNQTKKRFSFPPERQFFCLFISAPNEALDINSANDEFLCTLVSVEELQDISNQVKVFPNPTNSNLTIQLSDAPAAENYRISIFNLPGAKVFSDRLEKQERYKTLNLAPLPAGSYFLRLSGDRGFAFKKIIRQ